MARHNGGSAVPGGYYLNARRWTITPVARDGERLPGAPTETFLRIHWLAALLLALALLDLRRLMPRIDHLGLVRVEVHHHIGGVAPQTSRLEVGESRPAGCHHVFHPGRIDADVSLLQHHGEHFANGFFVFHNQNTQSTNGGKTIIEHSG